MKAGAECRECNQRRRGVVCAELDLSLDAITCVPKKIRTPTNIEMRVATSSFLKMNVEWPMGNSTVHGWEKTIARSLYAMSPPQKGEVSISKIFAISVAKNQTPDRPYLIVSMRRLLLLSDYIMTSFTKKSRHLGNDQTRGVFFIIIEDATKQKPR